MALMFIFVTINNLIPLPSIDQSHTQSSRLQSNLNNKVEINSPRILQSSLNNVKIDFRL